MVRVGLVLITPITADKKMLCDKIAFNCYPVHGSAPCDNTPIELKTNWEELGIGYQLLV
jgi:hypothetical protein